MPLFLRAPPPMEMLQKWILQHLHFFSTCCFFENDVLFLRKWRVVSSKTTCCSSKTTCCFFENDVLFLQKRRVTFSKRQVVFYGCLGVEKQHRGKRKRIPRILFVKIPIITLPRAHAYAHITGVFIFLLSQVSQPSWYLSIVQTVTVVFRRILTIGQLNHRKIIEKPPRCIS